MISSSSSQGFLTHEVMTSRNSFVAFAEDEVNSGVRISSRSDMPSGVSYLCSKVSHLEARYSGH